MTYSALPLSELRRLHEVADEYRSNGYKVAIQPGDEDLPSFLRGLRPDLLASNSREKVVIEVRSR